jgi:hypothetical protein
MDSAITFLKSDFHSKESTYSRVVLAAIDEIYGTPAKLNEFEELLSKEVQRTFKEEYSNYT